MSPERITNALALNLLLSLNAPAGQVDADFNPDRWLADKRNIALRIGDDLGMAEHRGPDVMEGHLFFQSRGRQAKERAKAMLDALPVPRVIAEVPTWRRDARLFMASLGYRTVGEAERPQGRVFVMERKPELNRQPIGDRTTADTLA